LGFSFGIVMIVIPAGVPYSMIVVIVKGWNAASEPCPAPNAHAVVA
jgi:hypothetical protein